MPHDNGQDNQTWGFRKQGGPCRPGCSITLCIGATKRDPGFLELYQSYPYFPIFSMGHDQLHLCAIWDVMESRGLTSGKVLRRVAVHAEASVPERSAEGLTARAPIRKERRKGEGKASPFDLDRPTRIPLFTTTSELNQGMAVSTPPLA